MMVQRMEGYQVLNQATKLFSDATDKLLTEGKGDSNIFLWPLYYLCTISGGHFPISTGQHHYGHKPSSESIHEVYVLIGI